MRCKEIEIYLTGYLDGELPQQQRQEIEVHLEGCRACRETLRQLGQVKDSTRRLRFEQPTGEDWIYVQNHILGRASRRLGWLILIIWVLMVGTYGAYWYANSSESLIEKLTVFGLISAIGLLLFSVFSERLRESRTDRYKGVHR